MESDHDASATDDKYYKTAVQMFAYCGVESSGMIQVDTLIDKLAPFIKNNTIGSRSEFVHLKSLLDPEQTNPEISTKQLAEALSQYRHSKKIKVDLDESFNIKWGPMRQDSDSGISSDGSQILEELQSELREKSHVLQQVRGHLEFSDQQHEEMASALTHERDSLRAHINILREENKTLTHLKTDYEEVCDRLGASEEALIAARNELETLRKRAKTFDDQIETLETENLTLQELLEKSKAEFHRINEMYASRSVQQSVLREENHSLRSDHADLSAKLQHQDEFVQQVIKEKAKVEMELKDILKSNQAQQRLDRSIDISYTEDQMLSALNTVNENSHFVQEDHVLDEETFTNAWKEDQGRSTNLSLFDEIRLSKSNTSIQIHNNDVDTSFSCSRYENFLESYRGAQRENRGISLGTQTSFGRSDGFRLTSLVAMATQTESDIITKDAQTECSETYNKRENSEYSDVETQKGNTECPKCCKNKVANEIISKHVAIQTDVETPPKIPLSPGYVKNLARNYELAYSNPLNSTKIQVQPSYKTEETEIVDEIQAQTSLKSEDTQTMDTKEITTLEHPENNNNSNACSECNYTEKLETDLKKSRESLSELIAVDQCGVECQADSDQSSVGEAQAEVPKNKFIVAQHEESRDGFEIYFCSCNLL